MGTTRTKATAPAHTAQVIAHPSAAAEPVLNPRHRGRYPVGVIGIARARRMRTWKEAQSTARPGLAADPRRDALAEVRAYERLLAAVPGYEADLREKMALARIQVALLFQGAGL